MLCDNIFEFIQNCLHSTVTKLKTNLKSALQSTRCSLSLTCFHLIVPTKEKIKTKFIQLQCFTFFHSIVSKQKTKLIQNVSLVFIRLSQNKTYFNSSPVFIRLSVFCHQTKLIKNISPVFIRLSHSLTVPSSSPVAIRLTVNGFTLYRADG